MRTHKLLPILILTALLVGACSPVAVASTATSVPETSTPSSPLEATQQARAAAGIYTATPSIPTVTIPDAQAAAGFPLTETIYVDTGPMLNSPSGQFPVDHYRDGEGRDYYLIPSTATVVEIDGRALLSAEGDSGAPLSAEELAQRVEAFLLAMVPDFANLRSALDYEAGPKEGIVFFTWTDNVTSTGFMPLLIQVGITEQGTIFAYINTVAIYQLAQ